MWWIVAASASLLDVCPVGCTAPTIQGAVAQAFAGDVIVIEAGVYPEQIVIDREVTLLGAGANLTVIDGGEVGDVISARQHTRVTLEGLTLRNSDSAAGAGLRVDGGDATMRGCWVQGVGTGVRATGGGHLMLENNVITDVMFTGVESSMSLVQARNNVFAGIGSWGVQSNGNAQVSLTNNVLWDIGYAAVEVRETDVLNAVWNATFETATNPQWVVPGYPWVVFTGIDTIAIPVPASNRELPPDFTDANCNDFTPQSLSGLVNAGDPNLRDADGTRSDIGVEGGPRGIADFGDDGDRVCGLMGTPGVITAATPYVAGVGNDAPTRHALQLSMVYRAGGVRTVGPFGVALAPFGQAINAGRLLPIPAAVQRLMVCLDVREAGTPRAYNCDVLIR